MHTHTRTATHQRFEQPRTQSHSHPHSVTPTLRHTHSDTRTASHHTATHAQRHVHTTISQHNHHRHQAFVLYVLRRRFQPATRRHVLRFLHRRTGPRFTGCSAAEWKACGTRFIDYPKVRGTQPVWERLSGRAAVCACAPGLMYYEVSAKIGTNVHESMDALVCLATQRQLKTNAAKPAVGRRRIFF